MVRSGRHYQVSILKNMGFAVDEWALKKARR
jgi:hypothetical protein